MEKIRYRHVHDRLFEDRAFFLSHLSDEIDYAITLGWDVPNRWERLHGITRCEILEEDKVMAVGFAFCSHKDAYCREDGRHIALKRARIRQKFTRRIRRIGRTGKEAMNLNDYVYFTPTNEMENVLRLSLGDDLVNSFQQEDGRWRIKKWEFAQILGIPLVNLLLWERCYFKHNELETS